MAKTRLEFNKKWSSSLGWNFSENFTLSEFTRIIFLFVKGVCQHTSSVLSEYNFLEWFCPLKHQICWKYKRFFFDFQQCWEYSGIHTAQESHYCPKKKKKSSDCLSCHLLRFVKSVTELQPFFCYNVENKQKTQVNIPATHFKYVQNIFSHSVDTVS